MNSAIRTIPIPIIFFSKEYPYRIFDYNSAADTYLRAVVAGPIGRPDTVLPEDLTGIGMAEILGDVRLFYFKGALEASEIIGHQPITYKIPGPGKGDSSRNMLMLNIEGSNAAMMHIIPSVSSGMYGVQETDLDLNNLMPLVLSEVEGFPYHKMIFCSPGIAHLFGYENDPGALIGRSFSEFMYAPDRDALMNQIDIEDLIARTGQAMFNIVRVVAADGKIRWLTARSTLIKGKHDKLLFLTRLENATELFNFAGNEYEDGSMQALLTLLQNRSNETHEHVNRVAEISVQFAKHLGIEDQDILRAIRIGGLLHDIGKVGVSDLIVLKPGPLTEEEWIEMKKHPEFGAQSLRKYPQKVFQLAAKIVRGHHLRWDGKGYPDKTSGEEIPLECRIISIVDGFEALTSKRPYKDAYPVEDSLLILLSESGKRYDPRLVELFVQLIRLGHISVESKEEKKVMKEQELV